MKRFSVVSPNCLHDRVVCGLRSASVLAFDAAARAFGRVAVLRQAGRKPVRANDALIAATAALGSRMIACSTQPHVPWWLGGQLLLRPSAASSWTH